MIFEKEVNIYDDDPIEKRFKAAETSISVTQGKISALISESELIELESGKATMYSKLASAIMDISSLTLNFSDLTTKYNTVSGQYSALDSKVAQYKLGVDGLSADITAVNKTLSDNYSTTAEMSTAIKAGVGKVSLDLSSVKTTLETEYVTNTALDGSITSVKGYADTKKQEAISSANNNTTNLLKSYSTTTAMNAAITASVEGLSSTVSKTYATTTSVTTAKYEAISSANNNTKILLNSYSTTAQMNSAINQKANEITTSVSSTYAKQTDLTSATSKITALETWKKEASVKITDSAIISTVTSSSSWAAKAGKTEIGTLIQQNASSVRIAWNSLSNYMQFENGSLAIYNGSLTTSQKRAVFDENGNHFYRDGYYVGAIGTNNYLYDSSKKGLVFDLEPQGAYMTWSARLSSSDATYTMKLSYVSKSFGSMTANTLHAGCDFDMHNYTLKNVTFPGGGITQTIRFVQVLSMNSDGTAQTWGSNGSMTFRNGILVDLVFYG